MQMRWRHWLGIFPYKILAALLRTADIFRFFPRRCLRLLAHGQRGVWSFRQRVFQRGLRFKLYLAVAKWWLESFFYLLDCLGLGEVYETLFDWLKYNSRPLHDWEKALAREIFGNSIHLARVRVDEYAWAGPRQGRFCYVSFYTINSWGAMSNSLLVHELVHVWQYQQLGMVYIPRALSARYNPYQVNGYDYGGAEKLRAYQARGKKLLDFNYEQQADIVADFYRIRNGYQPAWGAGNLADLSVYAYFVDQLRQPVASY